MFQAMKLKGHVFTVLAATLVMSSGCASLVNLNSPYKSWEGHPIEEFVAKQGRPDDVKKQILGDGYNYLWRSCAPTGRVVTYYGGNGSYYSDRQYECCTLTAATDEKKAIKFIHQNCRLSVQ